MTGEAAAAFDSDRTEVAKARHPLAEAAGMFFRNHAAVAGLVTLATIVVGSLVGPYLYTVDPYEMVWAPFSEPGEASFLFGTDYLGRDLFAGIVNGGRVTLAVGTRRRPAVGVHRGLHRGALRLLPGLGGRGPDAHHRVLPGPADPAVLDGARRPVRRLARNGDVRDRDRELDRRRPGHEVGVPAPSRDGVRHLVALVGRTGSRAHADRHPSERPALRSWSRPRSWWGARSSSRRGSRSSA